MIYERNGKANTQANFYLAHSYINSIRVTQHRELAQLT